MTQKTNRIVGGADSVCALVLTSAVQAVINEAKPGTEPIQELLKGWTNATDEPPSATAPSENPTSRIDYILCRPAGLFRVSDAVVIAEPVASDHRPVLAVLELPPR